LILRNAIKIVAAKCQILRLKCTKFDFGCGSAQNPLGSLQRSPVPVAGFEGPPSKGGEGGERMRGEGRGRRGKWRGGEAFLVM